jgi:hypothetical protein
MQNSSLKQLLTRNDLDKFIKDLDRVLVDENNNKLNDFHNY